jgi:hypothetical protein
VALYANDNGHSPRSQTSCATSRNSPASSSSLQNTVLHLEIPFPAGLNNWCDTYEWVSRPWSDRMGIWMWRAAFREVRVMFGWTRSGNLLEDRWMDGCVGMNGEDLPLRNSLESPSPDTQT